MSEAERRQALSEFLRTCRARLSPADVGLPDSRRRRTPGLRREEVALLANIGIAWYVSLEQGRDVHPSREVLESIADALQLTTAERQHLLVLGGQHPITSFVTEDEIMNPILQMAIRALDPHPAFVMGRRLDILSWNRAAAAVLSYGQDVNSLPWNTVWSHFMDPCTREVYPDWETSAALMVAHLRTGRASFPNDPWFGDMIDKLREESSFFRLCWARYDVDRVDQVDGHKEMNHPILGYLEFDSVTLLVPMQPGMRMILYNASPATLSRLEHYLAVSSPEYLVQHDSD
ncbi:helix-turn-helix domain-containing protein [Phototrophicus methaneseepsis]|uniref:Helix-turn-helix domain-containing protein n=1 Tax=Phototrophicus methaneseepsis TaxID=2710758 RepID=A0A7S8E7L8_9CHLR|nr:helix-turn-helix transcriptional regulator [Phototrophicus methaneseepsis]QPC81829.1 helix-turn-helix domain-containing protein [Phototrophicus methaneseepsis]